MGVVAQVQLGAPHLRWKGGGVLGGLFGHLVHVAAELKEEILTDKASARRGQLGAGSACWCWFPFGFFCLCITFEFTLKLSTSNWPSAVRESSLCSVYSCRDGLKGNG